MKKLFEAIRSTLKDLWNIYGGILLSLFIAWLSDFSITRMDKVTSFLVLTLTCISCLTFLKKTVFKGKANGLIDKATLSQKSVKAMKTAVDPMAVGEELGTTIVDTVNIIKKGRKSKIMNWIKKNKGAISQFLVAVLTLVGVICSTVNQQMGAIFIYKGYNIIGIVGGMSYLVIGLLTNPITSTSKQEAVDNAVKIFKDNKIQQANFDAEIQAQIDEYESSIAEQKAEMEKQQKVIDKYNFFKTIPNYNVSIMQADYDRAVAYIQANANNVAIIEQQIEALKAQQ